MFTLVREVNLKSGYPFSEANVTTVVVANLLLAFQGDFLHERKYRMYKTALQGTAELHLHKHKPLLKLSARSELRKSDRFIFNIFAFYHKFKTK